MNSEKAFVYGVEIDFADLNEHNILKPYAYQKLFAQIAEGHLKRMELDVNQTLQHNLSWALVSLSIEIARPVEGSIKLYANTWHSQRRGPFYRREFVFKNENGDVMFCGASFSVLLDLEKRTIYRKKELPFELMEPYEEFAIEASPSSKITLEFSKLDERKVYNSYLDCLGHVNNCRYGEFAYDAFLDEEKEKLAQLKRMDLYFLSELREKDVFSILKADDGARIFLRGYNDSKCEVSFDIAFCFKRHD